MLELYGSAGPLAVRPRKAPANALYSGGVLGFRAVRHFDDHHGGLIAAKEALDAKSCASRRSADHLVFNPSADQALAHHKSEHPSRTTDVCTRFGVPLRSIQARKASQSGLTGVEKNVADIKPPLKRVQSCKSAIATDTGFVTPEMTLSSLRGKCK